MFKAAPFLVPSVLTIAALSASSARAQFYSVGQAGAGGMSQVVGLSYDGRIAAGNTQLPGDNAGFLWTVDGGRDDVGRRPGSPRYNPFTALSGDGRVVAGARSQDAINWEAFCWTESGGYQTIAVPSGWQAVVPTSVNGDGSVIVGELHDESGNFYQPFRWTASGGIQRILNEGNPINATVHAVSSDGRKVVGGNLFTGRGYVWTEETGYQLLQPLDGVTGPSSRAWGISGNGSFIVGAAGIESTGAMWTASGAINLGKLAGYRNFVASEVSEAGDIVSGTSSGNPRAPDAATVWTRLGGIQLLSEYLAQHGIVLPMNVTLNSITGMSTDGTTFAGRATINGDNSTSFGYVVSVPTPISLLPFLGIMLCCRRSRPPH